MFIRTFILIAVLFVAVLLLRNAVAEAEDFAAAVNVQLSARLTNAMMATIDDFRKLNIEIGVIKDDLARLSDDVSTLQYASATQSADFYHLDERIAVAFERVEEDVYTLAAQIDSTQETVADISAEVYK